MSEDIIERLKRSYGVDNLTDDEIIQRLNTLRSEKDILDEEIADLERIEYMRKYHDKIRTETYEDFMKRMNYDR